MCPEGEQISRNSGILRIRKRPFGLEVSLFLRIFETTFSVQSGGKKQLERKV
jgi:hypothetical protein